MPQIENWSRLPAAIRDQLLDRMRDCEIGVDDLNLLRLRIESKPDVPEGLWYKDFTSFERCREGKYPKTFLWQAKPPRDESSETFPVSNPFATAVIASQTHFIPSALSTPSSATVFPSFFVTTPNDPE
jgi:hypothetical protein